MYKWNRKTLNKWTITSPCAHEPTLALGHWSKGRSAPVAVDGIGHRALKYMKNNTNGH